MLIKPGEQPAQTNPALAKEWGLSYVRLMDWSFNAKSIDPAQGVLSPWPQAQQPSYADNDELRQRFAIELAKGLQPFDAGLAIFEGDTSKALWVSVHWARDIAIVAMRDAYLAAQKTVEKPLDKEALLSRILAFADEKLVEAKDRLGAFRLYSDIAGFTGKVDINASTNTFTNKTINIALVKPEPAKSIEQHQPSNIKSEMSNENAPLIKLKLVGGNSG